MVRLTKPLLKTGNSYQEVSFDEAFLTIAKEFQNNQENDTLVMTSGDHSNEELYLLQKIARAGFKTNAIGSFDYYKRGTAFFIDKNDIVPFAELFGADLLLCILDDNADSISAHTIRKIIDACEQPAKYWFNRPDTLNIQNYGMFFRAINFYLIQKGLAKGIYVDALGKDYDKYKERILQEDFQHLLSYNNLHEEDIQQITEKLHQAKAPTFVVWERFLDERGVIELENLCMLLDIQAKPSSGFLCIKADLNSQGLFDMGIFPNICVGGDPFQEESITLMENLYNKPVTTKTVNLSEKISTNSFSKYFILNATNVAIPDEIVSNLLSGHFSVMLTSTWDENNTLFDLLLPASLPEETSGTYTDSARIPHLNKPDTNCTLEFNNLQQLSAIGKLFGLPELSDQTAIFMEYISFIKGGCRSKYRHFFR